MIIFNGAYYENSQIDIPNNEVPLLVTSVGRHVLKTLSYFDTIRPTGRQDFQLIYVKKGCIHYTVNNKSFIASENSILFYHPFEPQKYVYYLKDSPDIYWLHFTGRDVEAILKKLDLFRKRCYATDFDKRYERLFNNILNELNSKDVNYVDLCSTYLSELLLLISRNLTENSFGKYSSSKEFQEIINYINSNFNKPLSFNDVALKFNLSVSWLTRLFNKHLNTSPKKYLTQFRMEKAKIMLNSTNRISDIAASVGYDDPLYFSRLFRKNIGISPSEYRKQSKQLIQISPDNAPWKFNP